MMGNLFRKTIGKTSFRKATPEENKKINENETLEEHTKRVGESYFGQEYSSLSKQQKAYAREKAKAFRRNTYVEE